MSVRSRIEAADQLVEDALAIEYEPEEFDAGVARIETLLRALVEAQVATAEALADANEHRQLAYRVERPSSVSATRPYTGG